MKVEAVKRLRDSGLRLPFDDCGNPATTTSSSTSAGSTATGRSHSRSNNNNNNPQQEQPQEEDNEGSTLCVLDPKELLKLKPLQSEFLEYVSTHTENSLALAVNDSACDKTFEEVYKQGKVLGEGGFALVYQCHHKSNGKRYAVKEVVKEEYEQISSRGVEAIKDEIAALKLLKEFPHFVRLLDVFDQVDCTYLIMEEMLGGDLLDKLADIEVYPEDAARKVSRTLIEAVSFCHKRKIAHRDIKPENVLLAKSDDLTQIKLADFGCAKRWTRPNEMHTLCGSPQYVAPEVVGEQRAEGQGYNAQCDLWSCGVVIYILLGGYAPFESEDEHELLDLICTADYEFEEEYWGDVTDSPKQLIAQLLEVNPKKRLTARQALSSPWLRRRDSDWVKEMDESISNNSSSSSSNSKFGVWLEKRQSMVGAWPGSPIPRSSQRDSLTTKELESGSTSERTESGYGWTEVEDSSGTFAEGPLTPTPAGTDNNNNNNKANEALLASPKFSLNLSTE